MERSCDFCGQRYTAKTGRSRFCGDQTCKKRRQRSGATVSSLSPPPVSVMAAVREALTEVDRVNSPAGAAALVLASKLDSGTDTGSAMASLARELRAVLAEATAGVGVAVDPVDELRARRERRLAGGA